MLSEKRYSATMPSKHLNLKDCAMARYLTFMMIGLMLTSVSYAGALSSEKLKQIHGECSAVAARGAGSIDKNNAAQRCLSACRDGLDLNNGRQTALCYGAHRLFQQAMSRDFEAPIAQVAANVDYAHRIGWKVISTDNAEVAQHCHWITLSAAKHYPTPMTGHQMMIANVNEIPVGAVETPAVLINVRIGTEKTPHTPCTAEVVFLHCPPHRAKFDYCHP